jgi:epoxyqueuosine reductase
VRPHQPPPAEYAFGYRKQPRSGNEVNGLGQAEKTRARQVFHSSGRGGERDRLDWAALDAFFNLISAPGPFLQVVRTLWQRRLYSGPVASRRIPVEDPAAMAEQIKVEARRIGAGLVGITELTEDALYDGDPMPPYKYAISIGTPMNREKMAFVPQVRAATEVMRTYRIGSRIAIELAATIRSLGWTAQAYADGEDILQIPLAINAGLGQLGKHGSLISKEFGSNFRLAAVLTDLPLACDKPTDIGVDDLCLTCRRCTTDCPPEAIFGDKQLVRGVKKWYVDFDKCIPYFAKTAGCGICIEVCPWSEPGQGVRLSDIMLNRRKIQMEHT